MEVEVKLTANIFDGNLGDVDSHETEIGLAQILVIYSFREMTDAVAQQRIIGAANTFVLQKQHPQVTKEQLGKRWNIGISQAKKTLEVTTQNGVQSAILSLSRGYRTDRMYNQRKLRN